MEVPQNTSELVSVVGFEQFAPFPRREFLAIALDFASSFILIAILLANENFG